MVISTDTEKAFAKIQFPFKTKASTQLTRNRRELTNFIKSIYQKPTANIILKGKSFIAFSLTSWHTLRMSFLTTFI